MKLYVAGPMTGIPEYNYPAFEAAELDLQVAGYEVLNPSKSGEAPHVYPQPDLDGLDVEPERWRWYMRQGLSLLIQCDGIATLPNWWNSRGALLEVNIAERLGLPSRSVDEWKLQHA
jgi:hypothetical protein